MGITIDITTGIDITAGVVLILYSLLLFFTGYAIGRRIKDGNDSERF